MLRGHMELPSETRGIAVGQEIVVLTEEEYEALEVRKPPVSAEVIERARKAVQEWAGMTSFDIHAVALSRRIALNALLAAVEAGDAPNAEEPDGLCEECGGSGEAEWSDRFCNKLIAIADGLSVEPERIVLYTDSKGWAYSMILDRPLPIWDEYACTSFEVALEPDHIQRLSTQDAPEGEPPRVLRWEGYAEPGPDEGRDVIVRIHCDSIAARRFCGTGKIVHVESAVEAPAPAPDFDAMTPDDLSLEEVQALRDWLDERGRREGYENRSGRWCVLVRERNSGKKIAYVGDQPTEPAALLALCQKVAAKEAS